MATVIHIFKDGTVRKDLEGVKVPAEIVERIYSIVKEGGKNEKVQAAQGEYCI